MRYALVALFAAAGTLFAQAPLQIATDTLPAATVGTAYLQQLAVTGGACQGAGTATSSIDSGALPPGLFISSPSGIEQWSIQGTPNSVGTFTFTLHVTWNLTLVTPFHPACTDNAVKALTITVTTGTTGPPPPPPPTPSPLAVDRAQVSSTYRLGRLPPPAEIVRVISNGTASTPFTAQATTNSGGPWLSVSPANGVAPPGGAAPAQLSLSFSVGGLSAGVYTGVVTVASGAGTAPTITVTLTVILDPSIVLVANPASLAFSSLANGPAPAAKTLNVTFSGDPIIFLADVAAPPNGKWLSVTPTGGFTPSALSVTVDPKTLTPGNYSGSITLRVANVPNSSQTVPVTYSIQTAPLVPTITANGVGNAANLAAAIAPGTWVSIFGSTLSSTTRAWRDADFVNGKLPIALDGVSVNIDGKAAAVAYVSPTQINVLTPDDSATGLVSVQVKTSAGTSDNAFVLQQTAAPALFQFRGGTAVYVAGTHADGSLLAGAALVQQGIAGTPAKPGETIVLYGTGFGATQPLISATALVPAPLPLANPPDLRVRIGGIDAVIAFAGLVTPGLYQFNVVVPAQLPDGDQTVVAELRGLLTRSDLLLAVQH